MKPIIKGAGSALFALLMAATLFCTPLLASTAGEESDSSLPEELAGSQTGAVQSEGAEDAVSGSVTGFHVRARLPENQSDPNISYFSLLMEPEQEQVLEVEVINEGTEEIIVDVSAISASTNPNGIIDYKTPDVQEETLNHPFADLTEVLEESIQIPAGGTGVASVRVTMPDGEYDGAVLGGLLFTKRPPEMDMDQAENGAMIQNVYNYVVGVVLRENENEVLPDFELLGVEPNLFDNQPSFIHSIRNREAFIVKQMQVTASVYRGDAVQGTPVATRTQDLVDMAPNSVLEFAAQPEDGTLEAGTYTSEVVLLLDGREWRFTTSFMVQNEEANLVNDAAPFAPPAQTSSPNILLIVLIVILLLIVIILVIILLRRKNRRDV